MTKAGGRGAYVVSGISGGTMCLLLRGQNSLSDISLLAVGHIPTGHQNSPDISPQGQIYRSPNSKFYSAPSADNDKICELLAESFTAQLVRES